jgi:hypothetical protein
MNHQRRIVNSHVGFWLLIWGRFAGPEDLSKPITRRGHGTTGIDGLELGIDGLSLALAG